MAERRSGLPLPEGTETLRQLGKLMKWGTGNDAARRGKMGLSLSELLADGMTPEIAEAWRVFYSEVAARNPDNPSAEGRAELMERVLDLLTGDA